MHPTNIQNIFLIFTQLIQLLNQFIQLPNIILKIYF